MLKKVKQFVKESYAKSVFGLGSLKHFERTCYWLKKLKPDADEPMLIAAYAHDIQRAFRAKDSAAFFKDKELNDKKFLKHHETEGAKIIAAFLKKNNYDPKKINRIKTVIRYHEEKGTKESNLIKDADSISYLEINALKHIKLIDELGKDKIQRKFDWMYNRITSKKAKKLAEPFYKQAINELNKK